MSQNRSHDENDLEAMKQAAAEGAEPGGAESAALARARAEAHGLFLFGRTPEEEEIREMYGWGV